MAHRHDAVTAKGTKVQASTVIQEVRAINAGLREDGYPAFIDQPLVRRMQRAMLAARPRGAEFTDVEGISIRRLVQELMKEPGEIESFARLRVRALVLLRLVTLMRAQEPSSVSRRSIKVIRHPGQPSRLVVTFDYKTKASNRAGMVKDSNYVELLPNGHPLIEVCPGRTLLELRDYVEHRMAARAAKRRHDALFTDQYGNAIAGQTCSKIVFNFMRERARLPPVWKAKHLRPAANTFLTSSGVPESVVATRAGWHGHTGDATQSRHYMHNRFVAPDFASLIIGSTQDS